MRIDQNQGPQQLTETNRNSAQTASGSAVSASNAYEAEDQTELSGAHTQVQALVAQASQLPEVREERVHALRQAIQGGHYDPSPEKVAGALFTNMVAGSAA